MTLNLTIPQTPHTDFSPRITVIGVGGGGTNAVDNMIAANLQGVEFVVANTDAQQLMHSRADRRIQLGPHITQGLGAGAKPEIGKAAAEEAADELSRHLDGAHMVFITAGMGGGTGTGAAPVIARMARERNILTVGVVTKPFGFEGVRRARCADQGIEELQRHVDTLIVIPNQNLFRMANERTTWREAFKMADQVLYMGVRGVTDLMMAPGLVNLDFADIRTVMAEMGKAMMGTGEADGENRAIRAAEAAISNPLLEDTSMSGARGLLINITGGDDLTLFEVDQAANRIREEVDEEANIIFGSAIDPELQGRIRVSVVATGIDTAGAGRARAAASGRGGRRRDADAAADPAADAGNVAAGRRDRRRLPVPTMNAASVAPGLRRRWWRMADAMPATAPMMEAMAGAAPSRRRRIRPCARAARGASCAGRARAPACSPKPVSGAPYRAVRRPNRPARACSAPSPARSAADAAGAASTGEPAPHARRAGDAASPRPEQPRAVGAADRRRRGRARHSGVSAASVVVARHSRIA